MLYCTPSTLKYGVQVEIELFKFAAGNSWLANSRLVVGIVANCWPTIAQL
jgi:hypothetical protein